MIVTTACILVCEYKNHLTFCHRVKNSSLTYANRNIRFAFRWNVTSFFGMDVTKSVKTK